MIGSESCSLPVFSQALECHQLLMVFTPRMVIAVWIEVCNVAASGFLFMCGINKTFIRSSDVKASLLIITHIDDNEVFLLSNEKAPISLDTVIDLI